MGWNSADPSGKKPVMMDLSVVTIGASSRFFTAVTCSLTWSSSYSLTFKTPAAASTKNVFAYSNRFNEERGLVIYHNKFADTKGWIKTSAACIEKGSGKPNAATSPKALACRARTCHLQRLCHSS
jgi:hypothetical protein